MFQLEMRKKEVYNTYLWNQLLQCLCQLIPQQTTLIRDWVWGSPGLEWQNHASSRDYFFFSQPEKQREIPLELSRVSIYERWWAWNCKLNLPLVWNLLVKKLRRNLWKYQHLRHYVLCRWIWIISQPGKANGDCKQSTQIVVFWVEQACGRKKPELQQHDMAQTPLHFSPSSFHGMLAMTWTQNWSHSLEDHSRKPKILVVTGLVDSTSCRWWSRFRRRRKRYLGLMNSQGLLWRHSQVRWCNINLALLAPAGALTWMIMQSIQHK